MLKKAEVILLKTGVSLIGHFPIAISVLIAFKQN